MPPSSLRIGPTLISQQRTYCDGFLNKAATLTLTPVLRNGNHINAPLAVLQREPFRILLRARIRQFALVCLVSNDFRLH